MLDMENLQKEKADMIDREIESVFPKSGLPNLHDATWYHMETGGKRLRPLLAIVTYEALIGKNVARGAAINSDKILPFAAACEVLHNWILVHDDLEDGDKVRRDKPAVWVKYGMPHAINVGDYMAHKVFELVLKTKERGVSSDDVFKLLKSITDTTIRTAEGQTMDMNLRASGSPTEKDYIDMVVSKTAHYLTITMVGAAIVAKREELIPVLIEFGRNLGPAFQITDDILDLTEGKGRGEIGRDIKEGKRSILAIHCMGKCNSGEKAKLLSILNKTPEKTTSSDVACVKNLFEKYGSIDYARKKAQQYSVNAKKVADSIPELKDVLYFFCDYVVQRRK